MPLTRKEREKIGMVGKKILTNVKTGKKITIDYENEFVSVLTDNEARERLRYGKSRSKNFTNVYDENGKIVAYDEIIEKEDD